MKLKEYDKSFNKVQVLTCVKIVLGVESFQEEIRIFMLHECNENIVKDIFKLEELFGLFFLFICLRLLFCNYEKQVGMELIL